MAGGPECSSAREVARILRQCLREGQAVEIDGLGRFLPSRNAFHFVPSTLPKVFVAYVQEDARAAERIFVALRSHGLDPWLDRRKLLPGQNWPRAIEEAIETSRFVVACFSQRSVSKRGEFQAEIRYALSCARRVPLDDIFLIPVRLNACRIPVSIRRETQYIDLFPDWERGVLRVIAAIRRQLRRRRAARATKRPA